MCTCHSLASWSKHRHRQLRQLQLGRQCSQTLRLDCPSLLLQLHKEVVAASVPLAAGQMGSQRLPLPNPDHYLVAPACTVAVVVVVHMALLQLAAPGKLAALVWHKTHTAVLLQHLRPLAPSVVQVEVALGVARCIPGVVAASSAISDPVLHKQAGRHLEASIYSGSCHFLLDCRESRVGLHALLAQQQWVAVAVNNLEFRVIVRC